MPTNPFLAKFASSLIAVLSCHDRLIFKGHLPLYVQVSCFTPYWQLAVP
jgi:hypothetical protein